MKLQTLGLKYNTDKATYHEYLDFYQANLPKSSFTGRLLEIGVMDGASISMWREYYPKAEIVGIDIYDKSHLNIDGVTLLQMDATNVAALQTLGNFDIIIDDGSHMTADQQISLFWLYFNQLNADGYYVLEDLHTSLMPNYINSSFDTLRMIERLGLKAKHFRRDPNIIDSMTAIIKAGQ